MVEVPVGEDGVRNGCAQLLRCQGEDALHVPARVLPDAMGVFSVMRTCARREGRPKMISAVQVVGMTAPCVHAPRRVIASRRDRQPGTRS